LANRAIAVLSKLCAWCEVKRYRPTGSNPCRGLEKYSEDPRRRYLTPNELKRVGAALRIGARYRRLSPAAIASIRLLVLTGARVSEILSLKWSHVDLAAGVLRLPDSKTGAKEILLNAAALDVLKRWPRWARSPDVFPGEGRGDRKGAHRVNLTDAWAWMRRRAKVPDVRLHDLRHSFASVAVSSGQTLPIVGALLGHTQAQTTQRYAHLLDDPLRAASEATAASIVAAIDRRAK
jgi:integrase